MTRPIPDYWRAELDKIAAEPEVADPDALAAMLRGWRAAGGISSLRVAGQMLGVPARSLERIEQGRGFRYPRLLALALLAFDAQKAPPPA